MKYLMMTITIGMLTSLGIAVTPAVWEHTTESDFTKGEHTWTVVSSLGEISLARKIEILMPVEKAPAVVSAVAADRGVVYAASGTTSSIYRIQGPKAELLAELPSTIVCSLLWSNDVLLVGASGDTAEIWQIDRNGDAEILWMAPAATKYVWAMVAPDRNTIYAATGPEGKVYAIDRSLGKGEVIFEADKKLAKNILALARGANGLLYAGTDENGLVIEIDPRTKNSRVLLDAQEKEIAAIIPDDRGGLYVATSDAANAAADGADKPNGQKTGRPSRPSPKRPTTQAASQPTSRQVDMPKMSAKSSPSIPVRKASPTPSLATNGKGNAVYYIGADGLVRTRFRRPVTILAMIMHEGRLILGTGNGGDIYAVATDGQETVRIADTDAKQITALADDGDGGIVFGSANKGSVGLLTRQLALSGTYTSAVLDAKQIAQWGSAVVDASPRPPAAITFATRSGNVAQPQEQTWTPWSDEQGIGAESWKISSPAGRFLQYRLTLKGSGVADPSVRGVRIIYQVGNLAPNVSAVKVQAVPAGQKRPGQTAGPRPIRKVSISATDSNGDKLAYDIEFRQVGSNNWIRIVEKQSKKEFLWDTRTVSDGVYELRITASDSPSNPPATALQGVRLSEPVTVDNSAPLAENLVAATRGKKVTVSGLATDASTRIVTIHYSVDSQDKWIAVGPKDGIADSRAEPFAFDIEDIEPGPHRIAVKVTDLVGNTGYAAVAVTVKK